MKRDPVLSIIIHTFPALPLLSAGLIFSVTGSILFALLPPLVLERIVNRLADGLEIAFSLALLYFSTLALSGLFDALKEMMVTIFGQKITHRVRHEMCGKLSRLSASFFTENQPGVTASRFVNDVDTLETLFTSGVIGMFVDGCKILSILAVIFIKSRGLGILMLAATPLLLGFTRIVRKRILSAQIQNRRAVGKVNNQVPETIRNIRMIHTFQKESYFEERYDRRIEESYKAIEKTNFYDAVYSPVIQVVSALVIAAMMILAATGGNMQSFFGMSVGTAVAVTAYVGRVFEPLDSIGMEIQSIQSAVAGIHRIREFLEQPERRAADDSVRAEQLLSSGRPAVNLKAVTFGYTRKQWVLKDLSLSVAQGEQVTLVGRTGAGKSTVFKLLLGFYPPESGTVSIFGTDAQLIPDREKRKLFGYVEQTFHPVSGTVGDQISVFDPSLTESDIQNAARLAGIHETIAALPEGYFTPYQDSLFSQGERQLLTIARSVAADPAILLLDEITANLDSETEQRVLNALQNASRARTVISITHRLYEHMGGRLITIESLNGSSPVTDPIFRL